MAQEGAPLTHLPLSRRLAEEAWQWQQPWVVRRHRPVAPLLVLFAGVPLSGKSTIARRLVEESPTGCVHAENDKLRERAAMLLGRPPQHDPQENFITYKAAWDLVEKALSNGYHGVHDATNLTERGRRNAYDVADAHGANVIVLFIITDPETLEERASRLPRDRQEAHRKHHRRRSDPSRCPRPHIVLDGGRSIQENLAILRREPLLQDLWITRYPPGPPYETTR
jgi:predicted kinase